MVQTVTSKAADSDPPDLVVGIDFGMTYTGVAWTNLANSIQSLDDWPGLLDAHESKVPTKLVYGRTGEVTKWGFLCDDDEIDPNDEVFECFKIFLDQESLDIAKRNGLRDVPANIEGAKKLITDYLRQVYNHIKRSMEAVTGDWGNKKVEFIFSLPTTWQSLRIVTDFENAIRAAGFGEENPWKHTATLELTEAEAAGVYVTGNPQVKFKDGDIILVCDAGGGTTDLGLLEVTASDPQIPSLKQVAAVKGVGIGSTMIDQAFQALVEKRLSTYPDIASSLPRKLAQKLSRSTAFRAVKHNFGTALGDQPEYKLALDRLGLEISQDLNIPELNIERGRMIFTRAEIGKLFDAQIRNIVKRIDDQLNWMYANRPGQEVSYLVLSGGLGGSAYVKSKLEARYKNVDLSIIRSQEPRLSVVKGLVMDRKQKLVHGSGTLKIRIARASYGVICRQIYDPNVHNIANVEYDVYKKQKWAVDQISWLIRKGDLIDTDSARESAYSKVIKPGDPVRQWNLTMVISHNDVERLPKMLNQPGALKLCTVQADLKEVNEIEFDIKNKRRWQGKKYYLATFTVRVIIGPADLKFELWFKGSKYNRNHDPVTIDWDPAGAAAKPHERKPVEMP